MRNEPLLVRRGTKADLPAGGTLQGELRYALDTRELFIDDGTENFLINQTYGTSFKGSLDCSANPNYPAADLGFLYFIKVAGKIGGASGHTVAEGDAIICEADDTPSGTEAAVGDHWTHITDVFSYTTVDVGTTTTGISGSSASVVNSGTNQNAIFDFTIPTGNTGASIISAEFSGNDILFTKDDADTVTITNGKTDLKGDTGTAATIEVGTVTTLAAGEDVTITNEGTSAAARFDFGIPRGDHGETGSSITSAAWVGSDMVFTKDDATTVTITDAKVELKGDHGDTGASITSAAFSGDDIIFTKDDTTTVTLADAVTELKGETGATGATGSPGAGITPQTVGFTITGGTTPKTLTVALDASVSGTNTGDETTAIAGKQPYHGIESIGALSFDNSGHILTIATGVTYWVAGVQKVITGATTCDIDTDNTIADRTLYWFYFDDTSGTLKCGTSINLYTQAPVATVYWNGSAGAVQREYHSHARNVKQHLLDHMTIGCRYKNDGGFAQTAPTTAADSMLQIEIGTLYDEDLPYTTGQLTTMRCWHKFDATSFTFSDYALPYPGGSAGDPYWLDIADYTLKSVADSKYVCYWVYGSLDNDRPLYVFVSPLAAPHNTVALARAEAVPNLVSLGINPEIKLLYRWIYQGDGQYQEGTDYRTASPVPSGAVQSISASSVTSLAHGTVAATNVQSAIAELADEKLQIADIDDSPVDGETAAPISSNWAYDHAATAATASVQGHATAAQITKLDGIAAGANNYTHPTGDGNLHVPANSTTSEGKVLTAGASAGTYTWETPSASGSGVSKAIHQHSHGFSIGDVLYLNGTTYTKAIASAAATAEVVGMVSAVAAGTDDFTLSGGGYISGLSSLTAGAVYFLSPTTAGAMTATEPTTVGQISKPVLIADTTTSGYLFNFRGMEITESAAAPTRFITFTFNGSTALTTNDKAYQDIPVELDGMRLVSWRAMCVGASSSGAITIVIKKGADSMFSTNITIDAGETSTDTATAAVIDTDHDDIATGDVIEGSISGAGTGVTYCKATLGFRFP